MRDYKNTQPADCRKSHLWIVVIIAAILGAVYLSKTKTKRKLIKFRLKKWAQNMRDEVINKVRLSRELGYEEYVRLVDIIADHYRTVKDISFSELLEVVDELKEEWGRIKDEVGAAVDEVVDKAVDEAESETEGT